MPHTKGASLSAQLACESPLRFLPQNKTSVLDIADVTHHDFGSNKTPLRLITPENKEKCFYAQGKVTLSGPLQYEILDPKSVKFSFGSVLTNVATFFQALFLALMCTTALPSPGGESSFGIFNTLFFGGGALFFIILGIVSVLRNRYPKMKRLNITLYPTGWEPKQRQTQATA